MELLSYVWIGVIVASLIIEIVTVALVSIWFIPAAIVSFVLSLFSVKVWIQIVAFVVLSILFIFIFRSWIKKRLEPRRARTNADANIGKRTPVTETINNVLETGKVKLGGIDWTARSFDGSTIEKDKLVEIVKIEGVKLICKEINE